MKLFGPGLGGGTTEESRQVADVGSYSGDLDRVFDRLLEGLRHLPDGEVIAAAAGFVRRLENERLLAAARVAGTSGDPTTDRRRARNAMGDSTRSKRSVARDARRAAAVAANDDLGRRVAADEIGAEGIDALNRAADEETGRLPDGLIDAVAGLSPDQATRLVTTYIEDAADADEVNEKYRRQMEARQVRRYVVPADSGRPAISGLGIEGPEALIDRMWSELNARADAAYRANGGRDRPAGQHASLAHRRFDAAADVFFTPSASVSASAAGAPASGRPTVVITIGIEALSRCSDRLRKPATQIGSGPISDELLADYATTGSVAAVLTGLDGAPLWLGRSRRHGSVHQFLALAVRDRGCVLCGASLDRCVAHHLTPWSAPAKGRTDIDQLALLCQPCHRNLHDRNHTLVCEISVDRKRIWNTQPATRAETPAPRPKVVQRE